MNSKLLVAQMLLHVTSILIQRKLEIASTQMDFVKHAQEHLTELERLWTMTSTTMAFVTRMKLQAAKTIQPVTSCQLQQMMMEVVNTALAKAILLQKRAMV